MNNDIKFLFFLKKHTDADHPMTQKALREAAGDKADEIFGDKGTFTRRLKEIADTLNLDDDGSLLPEEKRKIIFPGYRSKTEGSRNGKIYYRQPVSKIEMDFLIEKLRESNSFTDEEKHDLEERLIENLCSENYTYSEKYP